MSIMTLWLTIKLKSKNINSQQTQSADPDPLIQKSNFINALHGLYVEQYRLIQTLCGGMGVTDVIDITDVTDMLRTIRDVAGVTDITDVAGVADVTDITGGTVRHMAFAYPVAVKFICEHITTPAHPSAFAYPVRISSQIPESNSMIFP